MAVRPTVENWDADPSAWEGRIVRAVARPGCKLCRGFGYRMHRPRPGWPYWIPGTDGKRVRVPHGGLCPVCVSPELAAELDWIPDP